MGGGQGGGRAAPHLELNMADLLREVALGDKLLHPARSSAGELSSEGPQRGSVAVEAAGHWRTSHRVELPICGGYTCLVIHLPAIAMAILVRGGEKVWEGMVPSPKIIRGPDFLLA